ncbi:MAG: choice-of-anchor D domain-containing protein [Acidobacteria bacterium]|nr:choice-of-anchor D domain-containing protein [Acidobacteriota bacterium]
MKSKRNLWVMALTLACFFVGASFWLLTQNSEKVSAAGAKIDASKSSQGKISLHISGKYKELPFEDAADLPEAAAITGSPATPLTLAKVDINSDGYPDLVSTYNSASGNELRVRLGTSVGNIDSIPTSFPIDSTPNAMAFGDFNLDGFQDVITANGEAGTISLLYSNSNTEFTSGPTINLGGNLSALAVADIDRDGIQDLLVLDQNNSNIHYFRGNGALETAQAKIIPTTGLGRLADIKLADFNNDYFQDLAIASNSGISVVYGDGKGNFGKEVLLSNTNSVTGMAVTDLNGDHFPDLAISTPEQVIIWNSRLAKGFSSPKSFSAGENAQNLVAGTFNSDDLTDLAVVNGTTNQVSVLLNGKGNKFSQPLSMDVEGGPSLIATGNFRMTGHDGIAIAKGDGRTVLAIQPTVITIQVSTVNDENDCPSCTSAQLRAMLGPNGAPGGGTGISLREALTALNNDFLTAGTMNQGAGFSTLSLLAGPNQTNVETDIRSSCGPNPNNQTYWFIATNTNFPPILAPGTMIDGSVVDTTTNGVNNSLGPRTVISGGGFVITSSAPNCTIRGLGIINTPNNAIIANSNGNVISNNNIGLDCDTITPGPVNGNGLVLSGSSNTMVTNNFIGTAAMNGILVNGISIQVPIPQNNTFTNNRIGINRVGTTLVPGTALSIANTLDGMRVQSGATGNTITNSIIGGNLGYGINIRDNITSNTIIRNCNIGVDPSGQQARPNVLDGIGISTVGNAKFNTVTQNLVSGNGVMGITTPPNGNGISISSGDTQAQFNVVATNKIGVNSTGSVQIPNFGSGISFGGAANGNTIGGTQRATFNQISGNGGPGLTIGNTLGANPNNNLIQFNDIGGNNLGTGAPFDPVTPAMPAPRSNKGGGVAIAFGAFANTLANNNIAFNNDTGAALQPNPPTSPPGTVTSGISYNTTTNNGVAGNFNTFTQNNIFLNPPDMPPTTPNIFGVAGNENISNDDIIPPNAPNALNTLIKIDSAVTITTTGQTTIKGTANFLNNNIPGNINNAVIEVFVSRRGAEFNAPPATPLDQFAEGQQFLNGVVSFQPDPVNNNAVDWSANLIIPAPFINPVQTPTVFLTATITTGDGSTSPFSIGLTPQFVNGVGTCSFTTTPSPISFSNVPVNTTASQTVTLTNTSNSLITFTNIAFSATNTRFALTPPSLPFTLGAGQTQTFTVTFTPTDNTNQTLALNITNTCTGTTTVNITGNGCQATIAATPSPVDFGTVNIGASVTRTVTVTNSGCQIQGQTFAFTAALNPNSGAGFGIMGVQGNVITLVFAPGIATITGPQTGTLVITSAGASNSPLNVPLTGNAVNPPAPVLTIQPNNVNFGNVPVNTTATQSITLSNAGNAALTLSTPVVQAGANQGFAVTTPPRLSLNPGESTTFQVSFTPNQAGTANGSVLIASNVPAQTITLLGNGVAPNASLVTTSVDFGLVPTGQAAPPRTVTVSNTGTAPLNITSMSISGGAANGFSLGTQAPLTIAAGSVGTITINFTPTSPGAKSDTLVMATNDSKNPSLRVSLTGSGTDNIAPSVLVQSPSGGEAVASGQQFTIRFTANDNVALGNFEIRLSTNGGGSFDTTIGSGVTQSGSNSFTAIAPTGIETTSARVQVLVRDTNNNVGMASNPANFTIGQPPVLFNPTITNGKFATFASGANIQPGAVLVIGNSTFPLTQNRVGSKFIVKRNVVGSAGQKISDLVRPGSSVTLTIRNPNGITSSPATVQAQ